MPRPLPPDPKEQFDFLVAQGESYIGRQLSDVTYKLWRKRAMDWLKVNAPNSELPDALVVVPINNVQRGLAVFLRARPIVPFLRETQGNVPPKPKNAKKVF